MAGSGCDQQDRVRLRAEHGPELGRRRRLDAVHALDVDALGHGCGRRRAREPVGSRGRRFRRGTLPGRGRRSHEHRAGDLRLQPRAVVRRRGARAGRHARQRALHARSTDGAHGSVGPESRGEARACPQARPAALERARPRARTGRRTRLAAARARAAPWQPQPQRSGVCSARRPAIRARKGGAFLADDDRPPPRPFRRGRRGVEEGEDGAGGGGAGDRTRGSRLRLSGRRRGVVLRQLSFAADDHLASRYRHLRGDRDASRRGRRRDALQRRLERRRR